MELDNLDKKILYELDLDSRQSISDLSRRLKQGRDRIEYRLDRLIREKVINQFVVSVDLYKLGYTLYKIYFRLENHKTKVAEFTEHLRNHPRTYWCAFSDGGWDLLVLFFALDPHEFHEIYTKILSKFNEVVLNITAYTLVEAVFYRRDYLVNRSENAPSSKVLLGGKVDNINVDKLDFKILRALSKDARLPANSIAYQVRASPQVVAYRIEQMEKKGVISGYRLELNLDKIHMLFFKTQFFLRNYELSLRKKFEKYCSENPFIISYIQQIGDCNVEIELEVPSYEHYANIIDEIRGEYSKLVRNYQSILIRRHDRYPVPQEITAI